MPRTTVDDEQVESVAAKLNNAVDSTLVPELNTLKSEVDALLGDGLVLQHTSGKVQESYAEFNTSVTKAVENIKEFAKQFQAIKNAVKELDTNIAGSIKN